MKAGAPRTPRRSRLRDAVPAPASRRSSRTAASCSWSSTAKYKGIRVRMHGVEFNFPPGPAKYAQSGTLVLPAFASARDAEGFSMNILDPLDYRAGMPVRAAAADFTQRLAVHIETFTADRPAAYWLWHPIPNDPFLAVVQRHRPDLLSAAAAASQDDEAVALAVEAASPTMAEGVADQAVLAG